MKIKRKWIVNGTSLTVEFDSAKRLLDVLRDNLNLKGPKEGCSEGECGSCTVLVDGKSMVSCLSFAIQLLDNTEITTIEGIEQTELGKKIIKGFVEKGAVQCGFCTPGMVLSTYSLLVENSKPTEDEIRIGLSGNLCRCTGYNKIVEAVNMAAQNVQEV